MNAPLITFLKQARTFCYVRKLFITLTIGHTKKATANDSLTRESDFVVVPSYKRKNNYLTQMH
jgi:hypothetical protein